MKTKTGMRCALSVCFALGILASCSDDESGPLVDEGADDGSDIAARDGLADLPFGLLTSQQEAALDACEEATGQRSFEDCPVQILCSSLEEDDVIPITVSFDPLTETCPWEEGDNLSELNGVTRARVEQSRDLRPFLEVPEGESAVFCSVDIRVEPTDESGLLRYDDDLLFVFGGESEDSGAHGGALLITRNRDVPPALEATVPELPSFTWPLYDWSEVTDIEISNNQSELYCLGYGELPADDPENCSLPETEESGDFVIKLPKEEAEAIGIRAALNGNYNLTTVITGDDNPSVDCQHNGFDAIVNVGFIVLPEEQVAEIILE